MRLVLMVLLVACGNPAPSPVAPPTSSDATSPGLDPATAGRLASASIIVRGRARVGATRDGHLGSLEIDAIYRGAIEPDVRFISAPARWTEEPAIYGLISEGDAYRVIPQGDALGLPLALEAAVIATIGYEPHRVWTRAREVVKAEVEVFRKAHGEPWSPAQAPAVAAARTIFASVPMIGVPASELERTLGPPDERGPGGRWQYTRHTGEAGAMFSLRFDDAQRARVVEIHRTQ